MVDKQQDPFSELEDFHDDLLDDHPADQKFGEYDPATDANNHHDDFSDFDDSELTIDSSNNPNNSQLQRRTSLIETLKTYGIVIILFGVVGYFGLKYSLRSVPKNNITANNTTTTAIPVPAAATTATTAKIDTDPVAPQPAVQAESSKSFDPLKQAIQATAPTTPTTTSTTDKMPLLALNSSAPVVSTPALQNDELKKELQTLKDSVTDINKKIADSTEKEKASTANAELQLQQFAIYMEGLNKGVGELSSQIQKQQKVLEGLLSGVPIPSQNINQNINQNSKNPDNNLIIEAVISGRAWIKTSKAGHTLSVGVGDIIPGYGKVIDINQNAGSILTDRGAKLSIN